MDKSLYRVNNLTGSPLVLKYSSHLFWLIGRESLYMVWRTLHFAIIACFFPYKLMVPAFYLSSNVDREKKIQDREFFLN